MISSNSHVAPYWPQRRSCSSLLRPSPSPTRCPPGTTPRPKAAIVAFVEKVSKEGSPDFVPEPERIAVFDNDGTLWVEHPMYVQLAFALDRVKALAPDHPGVGDDPAVPGGARRRHEGARGERRKGSDGNHRGDAMPA